MKGLDVVFYLIWFLPVWSLLSLFQRSPIISPPEKVEVFSQGNFRHLTDGPEKKVAEA
jgi:hypothetical protein